MTRLAVVGRLPTEWDSVQFVLGVDRFDVRQDSPHAPGYYLYIVAGRIVRGLTPLDTNHSLVLVAALASAGVVAVTYLIGRRLAGAWLGVGAAVLVATTPFVWFYGSIASTYSFDALAGAVLVLLALSARPGSRHAAVACALLGLAAGFRPTMIVLFAAVTLLIATRSVRSGPQLAAAAGAGLAGLLVWTVPMLVEQPGGFTAWQSASDTMFTNAARQTSLLTGSPIGWNNAARTGAATAVALAPSVAAGAIALVVRAMPRCRTGCARHRRRVALTLVLAAAPGLVFVALTHFPKPGYTLAFLPPLVLLALLPAVDLAGAGRVVVCTVIGAVALLSAQRFLAAPGVVPVSLLNRPGLWVTQARLGAPYPMTRAAIREADDTSRRYHRLRAALDPRTDVLAFDLAHFAGSYRYASYAMPEFRMSLIGGGFEWRRGWHRQQRFVMDPELVVPRGASVVLVMDRPLPDVEDLVSRGLAGPVDVPGGPVAVRIRPGTTLFGLPIVEGEPGPYRP